MTMITRAVRFTAAMALVATVGCAPMGDTPGAVYGARPEEELVGEVRWVDARSHEIDVRTYDGRVKTAIYDNRTRVIYRQQEYPVTRLEAGDIVAIRLQQDAFGKSYADLIQVRESVQERGRITASRRPMQRLDGTVERVDEKSGFFELREQYGGGVIVSLPYNARRSDVDRLVRLRRGDYVKVEGRFLNRDRFEIEAFL